MLNAASRLLLSFVDSPKTNLDRQYGPGRPRFGTPPRRRRKGPRFELRVVFGRLSVQDRVRFA